MAKEKLYEIEVFDKDLQDNGKVILRPRGRETAYAASPQELINLFQMCDQHIKILREVQDESNSDESNLSQDSQITNTAPNQLSNVNQVKVGSNTTRELMSPSNIQMTDQNKNSSIKTPTPVSVQESPPKYYKLGDIEIKNHNGVIYQKQWVKLTPYEASNFRVINSKTNKIVPLTGKSIEIKKWVMVETSSGEYSVGTEISND